MFKVLKIRQVLLWVTPFIKQLFLKKIMQLLSFPYALSFKDLGYVWMQINLKVTYEAKNCIIFSQINGIQYKYIRYIDKIYYKIYEWYDIYKNKQHIWNMNIKTKNVFHSFTNSFLLFQSIFFCSNFKIKITTFVENKLLLLKLVYFTIFYY